jgi:signal transduction histidine kinase
MLFSGKATIMFRSPIFIFLVLLVVYSCNDDSKVIIASKSKKAKTGNAVQAQKWVDLGDSYFKYQKFDSAFYAYNNSRVLYVIEKDSAFMTYNSIQMAYIQQMSSDYFGSEKNLIEGLSFAQPNSTNEAALYNLLGISSKELSNYDDALYYYDKAKSVTKDVLARLILKNNIANVYIKKQEYNTAIGILEPVAKAKILDTVFTSKARVLDNLGFSYFKVNRNQEGLDLMNQALIIRKKENDSFGMIGSYLHLSEYFQKSNPQKAKEYALEAYQTAVKIHSVDERLESLSFLVANDFGNTTNEYAVAYIQLNDSILKVRNNAKNQFAKIKYDSDWNRSENLKLKAQETEKSLELANSENQILVLSILGVIGIVMVLFRFNQVKSKSKREKLLEVYNTETRISKQLHDELANDVYHAMTFAETQDLATENNKETLLNNLDNIYLRTRNISKENSAIETGVNFIPNLKEMMANYSNQQVNVLVNGLDVLQTTILENNKKITVYRVIHELLVNMKKHSQCSLVVITFKKTDKKVQIDYSDNGVGATVDEIKLKNGLQNVENRIDAINGTITFDKTTNKGFKVSFTFPI